MRQRQRLNVAANALRHLRRREHVRARQEQRELLAAVARRAIHRAARGSVEHPRHLAQRLVALLVAIGVVERLEVIHVEHQEGERRALVLGVLPFHAQDLIEVAAVVELGQQAVMGREKVELVLLIQQLQLRVLQLRVAPRERPVRLRERLGALDDLALQRGIERRDFIVALAQLPALGVDGVGDDVELIAALTRRAVQH